MMPSPISSTLIGRLSGSVPRTPRSLITAYPTQAAIRTKLPTIAQALHRQQTCSNHSASFSAKDRRTISTIHGFFAGLCIGALTAGFSVGGFVAAFLNYRLGPDWKFPQRASSDGEVEGGRRSKHIYNTYIWEDRNEDAADGEGVKEGEMTERLKAKKNLAVRGGEEGIDPDDKS